VSIIGMASKDVRAEKKKAAKKIKNVEGNQQPPVRSESLEEEKLAFLAASVLKTGLTAASKGTQALAVGSSIAGAKGAASDIRAGRAPAQARNSMGRYGRPVSPPRPPNPPNPPNPPMPPKVASLVKTTYKNMLEMEKMANKNANLASTLGTGLATGLGLAAATTGVTAAALGAKKLHSTIKTEAAWDALKKRRPDLTRSRRDRENFEVLQQFSPGIASNVTTLESYMERMKHQVMTPHEFVGDLARIQNDLTSRDPSGDLAFSAGRSVGGGIEAALKRNRG